MFERNVILWPKILHRANWQYGQFSDWNTNPCFFATRDEIGLFAVALQLTITAVTIPDALAMVLMPRVAVDKAGKRELITQSVRIVTVICGVPLLLLVIFAKPIINVVFSPVFLPAATLVRILAVGVVVRCACKVFESYLLGIDRPGVISLGTGIGTFVNIICLWLLLPVVGLSGAAFAVVAGYLTNSAILTYGFVRISGIHLNQIWVFKVSDWNPLKNAIFGKWFRQDLID